MHPKLKAFMRTEAMECDVAVDQTPSSDAGGSAIENASEPQEMAATVAATLASTPMDAGQGAAQARLPQETRLLEEAGAMSGAELPKVVRRRSRNSKRSSEESSGQPTDDDYDTDDELQWCSKGIAVFLSPDEEKEGEKTLVGESMEVDQTGRVESGGVSGGLSGGLSGHQQQQQSKSMMACFKPKNKDSPTHCQLGSPGHQNEEAASCSQPPKAIGVTKPLPVTLASKSTPPPSIPHTFTQSKDIDMDTGETLSKEGLFKVNGLRGGLQPFIKLEKEEGVEGSPLSRSRSGMPNGCFLGSTPLYAHNPFTLMGNLPVIVKTEPGLSPSAMSHPRNSPLAGQTFASQPSCLSGGVMDYVSPVASLPPMEALQCMQLEELMRLNFVQLPGIKQEQGPRMLPLHARPHAFYQKPERLSKPAPGANPAKMFTCQQCGATFKHRHHVVRHMRAHTGEKPFRCDECGAMFARKCILTNHIRTHTGEKPYVCGECGDAFSRKHHLVIHRRTHTGEKPYICSVCTTAFARSHHLNRHLKTHILVQQGQLPSMPIPLEGAIVLSLQNKAMEHQGAVDLSLQKTCAGDTLTTTKVHETRTDIPQQTHISQPEATEM